MSLRVLMLNNEFPPLGGGTGTVNEYLIQQLVSMEDIVIDLVTSAPGKNASDTQEYLPGVGVYYVPVNARNIHHASNRELLTYALRALRLSSSLIRQQPYDACLAFSTVPAGGVALGLWYLHGLPYLVRVSGPDIPGFEQRYDLATTLLSPFIQLTWSRAQRVITKCDHERAMVLSAYSQASTLVIPNAVDPSKFRPAEHKPSEGDGSIRLLCVARLIERKGQRYLLEAAHRLRTRGHRQFTIALVGTGDAELELKALAQDLNIEGCVKFHGYIPREQMPSIYAEADIFVLPSFNEGMSVATLEAMAAGLPLVVTRASGLEELVSGNGLTFDGGDVAGLADALEELITSQPMRGQMGNRSRQIAQHHSWEQVGESYLALLSSLGGLS